MIDYKEDSHRLPRSPGLEVDIWPFPHWVVEQTSIPKVHRTPNDAGRVGISAAAGVNPQLAAKVARIVGRAPGDAGPVAIARRHPHLCPDTRLESPPVAPHTQRGRTPVGVHVLHIGQLAVDYKRLPALGNLPRRTAVESVKIAHTALDHLPVLLARLRSQGKGGEQSKQQRAQGSA